MRKESITRRNFLTACATFAGGASVLMRAATRSRADLAGQVGITASSLFRQMTPGASDRLISLGDLPRVLRDELGMRVIDLNTGVLGARDSRHLERFRLAVAEAGCVVTNLKVNATMLGKKVLDLPFEHPDPAIRRVALDEYKEWIRAAARIGSRWLRPFLAPELPDFSILVESYRELADFGAEHGITLLVENIGWIQTDPGAIPRLVDALRGRVAAAPDTGSWAEAVRYDALARAFPHAVTCDFKVGRLGPAGEHPSYNLRRCFDIGWQAGFRGPWCLEHGGAESKRLFQELRWIKEQIELWTKESTAGSAPNPAKTKE